MKETSKFAEYEKEIAKFIEYQNAVSYANRQNKLHMIVLGDDCRYWVAVPRVTEWLVRNGYEYAL